VYGRGIAIRTTLDSGGKEYVYSAGTAISTTVDNGGDEVVRRSSTVGFTTVSGGGSIELADFFYASGGSASVDSSDLLTVSVGGQTYKQQLSGDYTGMSFQVALGQAFKGYNDVLVTAEAPCYRSGTRILTNRGEAAVENLLVGDLVQTVLGETAASIIWIGQRDVDCARHPEPRKVWPVRIAAGAFGPGRPQRDLWLSPDHAVHVNEVLIPVRYLVNGSTIAQVPMGRVTYHHIELAQHDVLLAEGLPAESFLDMKDGSNYAKRPGPIRLYPDYSARMWEAFGCARLVVTGPELEVARGLVASHAPNGIAA
jgi:autotransporter passenger strand-loop-strand repeat protein